MKNSPHLSGEPACPEEMPKKIRHNTLSVQNDILTYFMTFSEL